VEPVTVIMLNSWVRQRVGQAPSGGGVTAAGPLRLWGGGEAFLLSHPRPQTFRSRCCQKTCCSQWVPAGALWRAAARYPQVAGGSQKYPKPLGFGVSAGRGIGGTNLGVKGSWVQIPPSRPRNSRSEAYHL